MSAVQFLRLVSRPNAAFARLSGTRPSPSAMFFRVVIWMAAVPPIMAYLGASRFGWRLGAREPLHMSRGELLAISIAYFAALLFGFVSTAVVSRWMAATYGARHSLGIHFALVTIIGAPLVAGSVIHLFPHVFINVIVLVPALIWSMYLLFRGLPIVLETTPEQGMLMASSIIAYLLVAFVSLLGISVMLWGWGLGPAIGV
jgi:hypothetical protein